MLINRILNHPGVTTLYVDALDCEVIPLPVLENILADLLTATGNDAEMIRRLELLADLRPIDGPLFRQLAERLAELVADQVFQQECYECGKRAELGPRSRCVRCEHRRAVFNEQENDQLREVNSHD